jgi:hypothetical protein
MKQILFQVMGLLRPLLFEKASNPFVGKAQSHLIENQINIQMDLPSSIYSGVVG